MEERADWFLYGYAAGDPNECDPYNQGYYGH
jgi:predicted metalloprotease